VVGKGVEHRTGGARITFLRGVVWWPGQVMSRGVWGNDVSKLVGGEDDVEDEEGEIPGEDREFEERIGDSLEDAHVYCAYIEVKNAMKGSDWVLE